jgi:hypothetical protein
MVAGVAFEPTSFRMRFVSMPFGNVVVRGQVITKVGKTGSVLRP